MSNQTPAPNDDVPRTPSSVDSERNDPAIDPQGKSDAKDHRLAETHGKSKKGTDTPEGNRYSPDDIPAPTQQERTEGKPTATDADAASG